MLSATLLFGFGLALTVAPLTATVLKSADCRHAGIASRVNNTVARVASLVAITAVGAIRAQAASTHAARRHRGRTGHRDAGARGQRRHDRDEDADHRPAHVSGGVVSLVGITDRRAPRDAAEPAAS